MPTPLQLSTARGALKISAQAVGKLAGLSYQTVLRAESGKPVQRATLVVLQSTLEGLGAIFDDQGGVKITPVDRRESD